MGQVRIPSENSIQWIHPNALEKARQFLELVYVDLHPQMKPFRIRPMDYSPPTTQSQVMSTQYPSCSYSNLCDYSRHSSSLDLSEDATNISVHSTSNFGRSSTLSSSPRAAKPSSRRLHHLWSAVKKFSPVKQLRSTTGHILPRKQKTLDEAARICLSNPDLSQHDLASIARPRSHDDLDIIALNKAQSGKEQQINRNPISYHETPEAQKRHLICQRSESQESDRTNSYSECNNDQGLLNEERHSSLLRHYSFFLLDVHLKSGQNLLAKDSNGTSDPYVKFRVGKKDVYKSRIVPKTLDPVWDEKFSLPIEDIYQSFCLKVWDHDFGFSDDYLGSANIDLTKIPFEVPTELELWLTESGGEETDPNNIWGKIFVTLTLSPKTQDEKDQYYSKSGKNFSLNLASDGSSKKGKTQPWDSVVSIVLVEGKDLASKDENGLSDPYVKFQLGKDRYKSKVIPKTLNPVWNERFSLYTFPNQSRLLEVAVYDRDYQGRDDFMGRATINVAEYKQEETHKIWTELEDGEGLICLMLTISGTSGSDALSNMNSKSEESLVDDKIKNQYSLLKTFSNIHNVGFLEVKVYRAEGLMAADMNGKSDPFCVIELVNTRVQTHTEYKTLSPEWNKIFSFPVKDVHEVLEVTVYDEDRDRKCEFLGKIAIPLLKVQNGAKKWYYLKDKKLRKRTKGKILLEMNIVFNQLRAYIRTFNPKETKVLSEVSKFRRTVFIRNVNRVKNLANEFLKIINWVNSCFQWESKLRSITAFIIFLITTYFFQLYMVPIALLLVFFSHLTWNAVSSHFGAVQSEDDRLEISFDADDDEEKETGEEKKSLMGKVQAVTEVSATVQNTLGMIASCMERVKNTFNFSVPFLSWLAIGVLTIAAVVLYLVPLRYLIMAWGINKFTKKLRNPNYISNNELLDFLSRVPDIEELIMYQDVSENFTLSPILLETPKRISKKKQ